MMTPFRETSSCKSNGYIEEFILGQGDLSFAVKDTLDVAGYATRAGCRALALSAPASHHAQVIDTLLNQRCVLRGKTTLHELAFGVTGINSWGGTPLNSHYPQLIPGGSSSGSATVVAAGAVSSERDARVTEVTLTLAGKAKVAEAQRLTQKVFNKAFKGMTHAQIVKMNQSLGKVLDNLNEL